MACIDITKLTFELSAQKMESRRCLIIWLCENGELRARRTGQTLRVAASHCEPQDEGNLNPFVWEQTWSSRTRNSIFVCVINLVFFFFFVIIDVTVTFIATINDIFVV